MSATTRTFTVTFAEDGLYRSSLSVDLGQIVFPIPCDRPIQELIEDFHRALSTLSEKEEATAIVSLKPEDVCEARLERKGSAAHFSIISRQPNFIAPKDGKSRYLVAESLEFEKMKRRISKGIDRYLEDPKRKRANQAPQTTRAFGPRV